VRSELYLFLNNSSFNVPRLAARRRTGMSREGQRIVRLMRYLTPRVVSPPRPLLVVRLELYQGWRILFLILFLFLFLLYPPPHASAL
jgi:hypothetical protein